MIAATRYFHFTLGPVQGFVAQARRTRDFWAGSFLLSWLAGVAMVEVKRQQGSIDFPCPPQSYLDWIAGQPRPGDVPPRQGAIPNRFKSVWAQVPADFDPVRVVQAVNRAWQALAEHIWQADGLDELAAPGTREIWERQHGQFWEISWALTDDVNESSLLDQRKNWRTHGFAQQEPGVKCMVMDGWQELSGALRPGKAVGDFWKSLRSSGRSGMRTDLGPGEQLCALAYVKRRFARHFARFETTLPDTGLQLKGWKLSVGMPSVAYMAAVHWLETLVRQTSPETLRPVLQAALEVNDDQSEWDTQIHCLREAASRWESANPARRLLSLDGNLFFRHVQDQPAAYGYDKARVEHLRRTLADLRRSHPGLPAAPSPYYAILLMDGDSLGSHMSNRDKQQPISQALQKFTDGVPEFVARHNGCLIYAGGDDVLAILPLEDALTCAAQVRQHYLQCFEGTGIPTTISAAVEFAHVKTPLGLVLGDAHSLLDDVAKDGAGRDALAVRVWKTSGQVLQWAQPWKVALRDGRADAALEVQKLAELFTAQVNDDAPRADRTGPDTLGGRFSSKFFFKIEERLAVLDPWQSVPSGQKGKNTATGGASAGEAAVDVSVLLDLLAVDFWHSDTNRKHISIEQAREVIAPLLDQCQPRERQLDAQGCERPQQDWPLQRGLRPDGALLVRFLATKGLDGDEQ